MERDPDQKHCCKICRKTFRCGRSLGGHMRSHVSMNSSSDADRGFAGFRAGYGFRENPKKSWRLSDSIADRKEKSCKDCGKEFPSWKALFGHMRCHSERNHRALDEEEDQETEQEGSWSGRVYKIGSENQSDNQDKALMVPKRKRRLRRSAVLSMIASSSSSISEYETGEEDVAISLMMLSRDVGYWGAFNPVAESSDKNSVVLEDDKEIAEVVRFGVWRNGYCKNGLKRVESDVSDEESRKGSSRKKSLNCASAELGRKKARLDSEVENFDSDKRDGFHAYEVKLGRDHVAMFEPSKRRSRYECTTCNKTFHSYQALGGHRASHKRIKGCFTPRIEGIKNSLETDSSINQTEEIDEMIDGGLRIEANYGSSTSLKKIRSHQCTICGKIFSSGQALGGHKRSHLVVSSDQKIEPDLLDLNLPAPVDEDSSNGKGNSEWWALVGMISN